MLVIRSLTWPTMFLGLIVCGCSTSSDRPAENVSEPKNDIATLYTVNYPLQYFAERIGGEHVLAVCPAPTDEDPAFWTPDAETITAFQQADLILLNAASYAKWTQVVSLPERSIVDTTASVADQYISVEDSVTHSHGPSGEHAHAGTAFTTWLDPQLALAQAVAIEQALVRLRPDLEADFQSGLDSLRADLNEWDRDLAEVCRDKSETAILFSHPVYQYLQRRYQLNAESVHWEPQEVPTKEMWEELSEILDQHPAKWMIWESEPIAETVKRLKDAGLQSVVFDPCSHRPDRGDFLDVMQRNTEGLRRVYSE